MKKFIISISLALALFTFAVSCQKTYTLGSLTAGAAPTPTNTPTFNQCTPTAMVTPNPWPNSAPANIVPPAYSGNGYIGVKVYDSTYAIQNQQLFISIPPGTSISIPAHDVHGVIYPPGTYYLEVGVTVYGAGGVSECLYQPVTIN